MSIDRRPWRTSLLCVLVAAVFATLLDIPEVTAQQPFVVTVKRMGTGKDAAGAGVVLGRLLVNGEDAGQTMENPAYRIPAGVFNGTVRYVSKKNFVQGPLGRMAQTGDFLLAIDEVSQGALKRTDLLFHGGNKAVHSEGCILLGAVDKSADGAVSIPASHPLAKMRKAFYGSADPIASPDKKITIIVTDEAKK